jgi:iron(III) transport system ATP-binding protein
VTHDQKEALSIADRMAILDKGRLTQIGPPEEIYRNPASTLVAGFIGETNFIPGEIEGKDGENFLVKTELGMFEGRPAGFEEAPKNGAKVTLSIRPECLSLTDHKADTNAIPGSLVESIYLGETAQYALKTDFAGSETIRISELNPRRVVRDSGQKFFATSSAEDVVILPRD